MNSKKALEELKTLIGFIRQEQFYEEAYKKIDIIEQDLERLEQLEKENQELLINKNVAQKIATKLKNDNDKLQKLLEYYDINY